MIPIGQFALALLLAGRSGGRVECRKPNVQISNCSVQLVEAIVQGSDFVTKCSKVMQIRRLVAPRIASASRNKESIATGATMPRIIASELNMTTSFATFPALNRNAQSDRVKGNVVGHQCQLHGHWPKALAE